MVNTRIFKFSVVDDVEFSTVRLVRFDQETCEEYGEEFQFEFPTVDSSESLAKFQEAVGELVMKALMSSDRSFLQG